MCTLILGRDILAPGTTILAANRDEDPARPSEGPRVLLDQPRVAGGSDQRAGGTWLAVRTDGAVAMLNRRARVQTSDFDPARGIPGAPTSRVLPEAQRSRGLLALDVAGVPERGRAFATAAHDRALGALVAASYAPFTLVFVAYDRAWLLAWDGMVRVHEITPGWHVLTHTELDDPEEPRTRRLCTELETLYPPSLAEAQLELIHLLAAHDDPAVCIHEGRMATVSYSLVFLTRAGVHYRHGDGRPCERSPDDYTALLDAPTT